MSYSQDGCFDKLGVPFCGHDMGDPGSYCFGSFVGPLIFLEFLTLWIVGSYSGWA